MAMASDDRITVTVEEPPTATSPFENISDSSIEDEAEISQPSYIHLQESITQIREMLAEALMRFQERNTQKSQILEPLPKARDHLMRVLG
ncbi:hypothetical protein V6N13_090300 [Hibiscus sabdariffa]